MNGLRAAKILLGLAVGTAAAVGQGYAIFVFENYDGSFVTTLGLKCILVPALIELVVGVVTLRNLDQLHANAVANPHSLLGQALRHGTDPPPAPPTAREAWDGHWEEPDRAADRMSGKP